MFKTLLKEFKFRKLFNNYTKNIIFFFKKKKNTFYFGIDPTFHTLHLGHLLGLSIINKLYYLGYKNVIIVLGVGTTLINRNYNIKVINKNIKYLKKILKKLIYNKNIKIINNYKWLKKINLLKFITNILNKFSIYPILKNQLIKTKIKNNIPLKLTDIIYHLLQGYDYFYLNKKFKCLLQIGGADQWYNIITGIKIIKLNNKYNTVHGFTYPLLLNNKGEKFSKSNKKVNNIWINPKLTSIYNFSQYFINLSDEIAIKYFKYFSNLNILKIKFIIKNHLKNKKSKLIQYNLLKFFIIWIYGKKIYKEIIKVLDCLFYSKTKIKNNIYLIKKYIPNIYIKFTFNKNNKINFYDIIKYNKVIFKSYSEYKRYINNSGILLINGTPIKNNIIEKNKIINNKYIFIQKGKKKYFLLIIKR
ncbi:MAG: tyrosine--tRNA ligase [Candidatus Shikimatogenerans bostrichidophilus]|nr:MAG: tyrosine--tRNA ligase [Candidatus Shikimatogenerans bostrichidophilus]